MRDGQQELISCSSSNKVRGQPRRWATSEEQGAAQQEGKRGLTVQYWSALVRTSRRKSLACCLSDWSGEDAIWTA